MQPLRVVGCLHTIVLALSLGGCGVESAESSSDGTQSTGAETETETETETDTDAETETGASSGAGDRCSTSAERLQPDPDATPSGIVECSDGFAHRERSVSCVLGPWATGNCGSTDAAEACREDAECTEGGNGFCRENASEPTRQCGCTYACTSDADCEADQACHCDGARSRCIPADCRSDDDCGGNAQCALDEARGACGDLRPSLSCTTPDDECRVDADCDACQQCLKGFDGSPRACSGNTGICGPCG